MWVLGEDDRVRERERGCMWREKVRECVGWLEIEGGRNG